MMWKLFALLAACVLAKPIDISVDAPWRSPSETLLVLETVAKYNQSSFFPLLSVALSAREKKSTQNEIELLYETALSGHFLSESQLALAKQEYLLGSVLPQFEVDYQQFENLELPKNQKCDVVMWTQGTVSCDISDLFALQFTAADDVLPTLTASEKVIGSGDQWIVLYADIDSPEFAEWHAALLSLALEQKITYVLRYRPITSTKTSTVAGYGVGLHLKRTDYLVVDDRQLEGEKLTLDLENPTQVPASKAPFLSFGAANEVRDLDGSDLDKLAHLQDLSFNFPSHAARLAVSASEADEEAELQKNPGGGLGATGLFVNGLYVDDPDAFSFYDTLRNEEQLIRTLQAYLPDGTDVPALLVSGAASDSFSEDSSTVAKYRYDLRAKPQAIGWINDIETDRPYSEFDPSIEALLQSEGPFAEIRRNIHTMVVAGKLEDRRTLALLAYLFRLVGRQLPIQIGLVSPSPLWSRVAKLGIDARQAFLVTLLRTQDFEEAVEMAQMAYEESGNPQQKSLGSAKKWMDRFGVDPEAGPVIFVNGFPLALDNWQEATMHIFSSDAEQLRSIAGNGDSEQDFEEASLRDILFSSGATERNTLVDPIEPVTFAPWSLSPQHLFANTDLETQPEIVHSIQLSSSFTTPETFDLLDHLLLRAAEDASVEVAVRPLSGVNEQFYATLLDSSFNMFRFARDLVKAAKGHLFESKTPPKVFNAAAPPAVPASSLPSEQESIIIDGRQLPLTADVTNEVLDKLLDRETPRVRRLRQKVPGISGPGIAALSSSVQNRIHILDSDVPDISIKSSFDQSSVLSFVVDPASPEAQQLLGLTELARKAGLSINVHLSPARHENVLNRFYRGVFNRFEHARFESEAINEDTLYTVEIIEPNSWLTVASESPYDLDNVILNLVKEDEMRAVYSLRSLLIEGFALGPDAPGTRLQLLDLNGTKLKDTVIMANLGYFQLQAERPGVYYVCTADDEHSFYGYDTTSDCIPVTVSGFSVGNIRPGILLSAPQTHKAKSLPNYVPPGSASSSSSIWGKVGGLLKGSTDDNAAVKPADVNIFTVASGHLYERFASIMMLSTMKHATHSVKFWLIENFMSPKFKEFVPELAAEYGFDYEFVSYKWPSWLRSQSEKQREIWGYKMLFLDVLFPQELSNVIFVDSDQIVRTDFKELIDLDLQGAPYAFTPMGDDREEMEPFRFWKQGYWKRTLLDEGLKYHISALYRVDLARFRELRVGDVTRQHYQRLSADPESLANLDQDLPNSLQPNIPIYSLPESWLWCETWCSDESLKHAKTIDLCNNPLTKEPKLDRARRQISEWTTYDEAVAELQQRVDTRQPERSSQLDEEPERKISYDTTESDTTESDGDVDHIEL